MTPCEYHIFAVGGETCTRTSLAGWPTSRYQFGGSGYLRGAVVSPRTRRGSVSAASCCGKRLNTPRSGTQLDQRTVLDTLGHRQQTGRGRHDGCPLDRDGRAGMRDRGSAASASTTACILGVPKSLVASSNSTRAAFSQSPCDACALAAGQREPASPPTIVFAPSWR